MSELKFSLPYLRPYPERGEPAATAMDTLERALLRLPVRWFAQLGGARHGFVKQVLLRQRRLATASAEALNRELASARCRAHLGGGAPAMVAAMACVVELAHRQLGAEPDESDIAGARGLLAARAVHVPFGHGQGLAAVYAACVVALAGNPVHLVTASDWLAVEFEDNSAPLFAACGLRHALIQRDMPRQLRRGAYAADIVIANAREFAFDYLLDRTLSGGRPRDLALKVMALVNERSTTRLPVMRGLPFAIVTNAQQVLVDDATEPMVIAEADPAAAPSDWAAQALGLADAMSEGVHFTLEREAGRLELTAKGRALLREQALDMAGSWGSLRPREEGVLQALRARHLVHRGKHYVVVEGRVRILDPSTGSIVGGRSWGGGMHQLLEVKEGCAATAQRIPAARIAMQDLFNRYARLAALCVDGSRVAREIWDVYNLAMVRPGRADPQGAARRSTRSFPSATARTEALTLRARQICSSGGIVLIGCPVLPVAMELQTALVASTGQPVELIGEHSESTREVLDRLGLPARISILVSSKAFSVPVDGKRWTSGMASTATTHLLLLGCFELRSQETSLAMLARSLGTLATLERLICADDPAFSAYLGQISERKWVRKLVHCSPWLIPPIVRLGQWRMALRRTKHRKTLLRREQRLGSLLAFSGE